MYNFILTLENKVYQIVSNFNDRKNQTLIDLNYLFFPIVAEMDLSPYQVAFLELFFDIRNEIIGGLNKELDVFFTLHREWTGATFEGVVPPSDNSTEWIYRVGLLKGGFNRVAYLEFQFHEWSIVKYSLHNSF